MIKYGNMEGAYFTQWRIDFLKELFNACLEKFEGKIQNVLIWYDNELDYHRLDFELNGHKVEIRYYKKVSIDYDGKGGFSHHWPFNHYNKNGILNNLTQNCCEVEMS